MAPCVAVVKCESYDEALVHEKVCEAINLIGGIERFVKPGDRVLLKINLLSASSPDKAVTTHPSVVKAMVREVLKAGGKPIIGDSPGGPFNKIMLDNSYEKSGMTEVARETGAALNYNTGWHEASYPGGLLLKRLDLIDLLDEVDVVITLPKLKTHTFTGFTGATKILFGVVPGLTKPTYHMRFSDVDLFSDMLLDILGYVKPSFALMDAVVGIEGDGPGVSGSPKKAGVILASADSIALDVVATSIIGMEPTDCSVIRRAVHHRLSSGKLSDVEVLGEKIENVKTKFMQPSGASLFEKVMHSRMLRRLGLKIVAPYPAANDRCVKCGVCVQNCPAKAITIRERAEMDLQKCIRCYCCHELCPHKAIDLKSWLGFLNGKKK